SGLASWRQVLESVADAWAQRAPEIRSTSNRILERLSAGARLEPSVNPIRTEILQQAVSTLAESYDRGQGGFGGAPKFPPSCTLEFLLARASLGGQGAARERRMSLHTLEAMARGGIYDQVAGGFSRYAVDSTWTVPHFEKMLYDNALLARAYLHGWQLSGDPLLLRTCRETLDWALREMRAPEGGFYSALDADSEGVEGRFYVWTIAELEQLLGDDAAAAIEYFGVSEAGNFESAGANVLEAHGPEPPEAVRLRIRERLARAREGRVRPGLDDKRLTAWNALMIAALADAAGVLASAADPDLRADGARYGQAAQEAASFVLDHLRDPTGRLLRSFNHGQARLPAYLEDHAFLLEALLVLYEATFQERWFEAARQLADTIVERFADPERGGFYSTASDHEPLIARRKDLEDAPIPSGASSAALGLMRLAALTGEDAYRHHATGHLRLLHEVAPRHPTAFGHLLQAIELYLLDLREVALVGDDTLPLREVINRRLRPDVVLAGGPPGATAASAVALLKGREERDGRATAYVCQRMTCQRPVTEPAELAQLLGD
ncbi:MAG TPA: thioredoxin domain-containing protein, partial [Solirubrobacteraceae bacterium]|nr:thioredoxin domain-containing protein [Solirubrobacteraceae bacterium]